MTIDGYTIIYGVPTRDHQVLFSNYSVLDGDDRYQACMYADECSINEIKFDITNLSHDQNDKFDHGEKTRFFDYLLETKLIDTFSSEDNKSRKLAELLSYEFQYTISDEKRREWVSDDTYKLIEYNSDYADDCIRMKEFVDTYLSDHSEGIHRKFHGIYYAGTDDHDDIVDRTCMIVGVKICSITIGRAAGAIDIDNLSDVMYLYTTKINNLSDKLPVMFTQKPKIYFVQNDCCCCS